MYVCISLYVYLHAYVHTHINVFVAAVMVTLILDIIPTEDHSLAVRSSRDSDKRLNGRIQSVTGADDFMGQGSMR